MVKGGINIYLWQRSITLIIQILLKGSYLTFNTQLRSFFNCEKNEIILIWGE